MNTAFRPGSQPVSVLLPYFNEAGYIAATLQSLLTQSHLPGEIVLVDNGSTDGSEAVCRAVLEAAGYQNVLFLREPRPGKTHALESGLQRVTGEIVAVCDADTHYPHHYLELALRLFDEGGPATVAAMGQCVEESPYFSRPIMARVRDTVRMAQIFRTKCFAGGAGQVFRAQALREAGGFSEAHWKYVLEDHEIMHRLHRLGRSVYHEGLWCVPSDRRSDRREVRWNLAERLLYRYTPHFLGDWYFYRFLGPRFEKRRLYAQNLRVQPWLAGSTRAG
jgi:glycosyltransferase involved in cell wall biosynthesis